jgi:hypothetical protein
MKSPISMRNGTFNTSKCRGKKWGCYTPILPKALAHSPNFQNNFIKIKKFKKKGQSGPVQALTRGRRVTTSRQPRVNAWIGPDCPILNFNFFLMPSIFCARGQLLLVGSSTCLALPKLLPKTSNTHNFCSVTPKIMKFMLM